MSLHHNTIFHDSTRSDGGAGRCRNCFSHQTACPVNCPSSINPSSRLALNNPHPDYTHRPPPQVPRSEPGHYQDPELTSYRYLVNAFFTYCNPHRFIIHKASFLVAMGQKSAPLYLILAVCASAALFGRQDPRVAKYVSEPFVDQATSLLFDNSGELICEPVLAVAQALCLLHLCAKQTDPSYRSHYKELAIQIIHSLHGNLDVPSPPSRLRDNKFWVQLECTRRIFWLLWLVDAMSALNSQDSILLTNADLLVPLPIDEVHFKRAECHQKPEYAHVPIPKDQRTSEFGQVIRILLIFVMFRFRVNGLEGLKLLVCINDYKQAMNSWVSSLPSHLLFSENLLREHMFHIDTSSSSSSCAWSFCCMHLIHASSILATSVLGNERTARLQRAMLQVELVTQHLGRQTKSDILMKSILLCMIPYLEEADIQEQKRDVDQGFLSLFRRVRQSIEVQLGSEHNIPADFSSYNGSRTSSGDQFTLPPLKITGLLGRQSIPIANQTPA